ncbi:MAG: hypothetical protein PUF12_00105 [Thermoflexaceae bacterium]|nr:hypothetical protein [Thermoflexaceae bacterium]
MVVFSQCLDCKNFIGKDKEGKYICKAYPEGIAEDIFWNRVSHKENIDGDKGFKYEEIN